jgi:F420-0:gamma-glutamyl ligase-like protein|uniref:Coenzyme F420:L-glutamate ligase-like domain-containing protein n=1 Tax=candidate division WOR-3 bacterium TaxID=2052148 RepID=A0A7C3YZE3_UNCW3
MKRFEAIREIEGRRFERILVKTHILTSRDEIGEVVKRYAGKLLQPGDIITISESAVAITQGRAIPTEKLKPRLLARLLWRFVRKVPYGIGLRNPYSMECAIREVGEIRIIIASFIAAFTKLIGRRGDFYRIAGKQAAMIDAPHTSGVKEYYECVIMGPKEPDAVARRVKKVTGFETAIMDVNDIGGSWVVGASSGIDKKLVEEVMRDNPAGQGDSLTPIVIIREVKEK